jgi:arginase family enzyme
LVSSDSMRLYLTGPTYVSIDMDVGSLSSVFSARFMNCYGLTVEEFVGLLSVVRRSLEDAEIPLVGLDIMEVDIHFLEASEGMPVQDYTRYVTQKAFEILLSDAGNP